MTLKKRTIPLIIFLTAVVIVVIGISQIAKEYDKKHTDMSDIRERGQVNIVTNYNSVSYYASGDTICGFTYEMLNELKKTTNLKLHISVENNIEKCIKGLEEGEYDIIAQNIPVNESLKYRLSFTKPIIRNKLVLVQRIPEKDEDRNIIRNHLKLAKTTIYVPHSSPAILRLKNLSNEIGDTIYIKEDSLYDASELIMKVASKEIDYTVCDVIIAQKLKKTIHEIDIKTDIGFTHLEAWAVRNTSPLLLDSLNYWINEIQSSKKFDTIYRKYYK